MAIQRGEIYFVNLNPVIGREQGGTRPVVVVSSDIINRLPLVVTIVIGTKGTNVLREFDTNVRVPPVGSRLREETVFLGFQIRALDVQRFPKRPVGSLSDAYMTQVESVVRYCLQLQ